MRILLTFMAAILFVPGAAAEELKSFKDGVVGCDNLRTCTALGLPPADGDPIAYVKIVRGGDGRAAGNAQPAIVSLSGASASLLHVDDVQKRVGTVTALRSPGSQDATTIPPPAAEPAVAGVKMSALPDPLPSSPSALPKPGADANCPEGSERMAFALSETQTLWGICTSAGAYNLFFDFFLVERDKARPAVFPLPPTLGESGNELANPELSEDGLSLASYYLGRGLGDCGSLTAWAWDGAEFHRVKDSTMDDCRGVLSDDWPVLYRAKPQ